MIYVWRDWRFLGEAKYLGLPTRGGLALGQRGKEENIILKRGDSHDKIFLINVQKHLIEYMNSGG